MKREELLTPGKIVERTRDNNRGKFSNAKLSFSYKFAPDREPFHLEGGGKEGENSLRKELNG